MRPLLFTVCFETRTHAQIRKTSPRLLSASACSVCPLPRPLRSPAATQSFRFMLAPSLLSSAAHPRSRATALGSPQVRCTYFLGALVVRFGLSQPIQRSEGPMPSTVYLLERPRTLVWQPERNGAIFCSELWFSQSHGITFHFCKL